MKRMKGVHITHASWDICNCDGLEINRNKDIIKYEKGLFVKLRSLRK